MKSISLTIQGNQEQFEIRPPSLFNRSQFFMLLATVFGVDTNKGEELPIDLDDIFTLSPRDFKRFLTASVKDDNHLLQQVDVEDDLSNYQQAQAGIRAFFLNMITTVKDQELSTKNSKKSKANTNQP